MVTGEVLREAHFQYNWRTQHHTQAQKCEELNADIISPDRTVFLKLQLSRRGRIALRVIRPTKCIA